MKPVDRCALRVFLLVILCPALAGVRMDARAAADTPTSSNAPKAEAVTKDSKPKITNPMRGKEPMSGGMKRDGMMKEDVRKQAIKKDQMMREAMKNEGMKK